MQVTDSLRTSHLPRSIPYRPEIDGLRAMAIVPVVIFHLGASWLPGGFVGVDVFFVISGYLISSIILKDHSNNAFSFKNFWMRRIRRIMPAMLAMLLGTLIAGYVILFSANWADLGWQSISTLALSSNILFWRLTHDYWGPVAETLPLLHNWSLSIEEQFYLIYPFFIIACLKWFPKKLALTLAGITAASFALCVFATARNKSAAFYLLPTRAWELSAGCLLAVLAFQKESKLKDTSPGATANRNPLDSWGAFLGLSLIVASWFLIREKNFPGWIAAMPVIGSMLVIRFAGNAACGVTAFLSYPFIRWIGKISYSLYLWHWPIIVVGRAAQVRWETVPFWPFIVLIPILAVASYNFVESPGRRLGNPLPLVVPTVILVAFLSIGLILVKPAHDLSAFAPTVWMGDIYDSAPRRIRLEGREKARLEGITRTERDARYANAYSEGGILKRYGSEKVDVLVLGDSHALMWAPVIDDICRELKLSVLFYAADGTDPFPDIPAQKKARGALSSEEMLVFDSNRLKLITNNPPRLVIVASRLRYFTADESYDKVSRFLEAICAQGSEALFIEDPPELAIGSINAPLFLATTSSTTIKAYALRDSENPASMLLSLSDSFKCFHTLETADLYFGDRGRVTARNDKTVYYIDDNHLSLAGAGLAKKRIRSAITHILQNSPAH